MKDRDKLRDYEWLLQRLYQRIPPKSGSAELEIPEPEMIQIGSKVIVRNFRRIAEKLKRDPYIVARYLLKEMGTGGKYEEESGHLTLDSQIRRDTIMKFLKMFEKTYIRCPTCMSIDTRLERREKERIWFLVCEACGAEQPVKPI